MDKTRRACRLEDLEIAMDYFSYIIGEYMRKSGPEARDEARKICRLGNYAIKVLMEEDINDQIL